jgi:MoaA/NifB/PqqE/SkfB family radical SAM enzyme
MDSSKLFKLFRYNYGRLQARCGFSGLALPPLSLFILLTARCNLRCAMCFLVHQNSLNQGKPEELSRAEVRDLVRQTPFYTMITFTGGEPFSRSDFPEILAETAACRRVHLITNGTRLTPETARQLVALAPERPWQRGLMAVGVSILGPEPVHDAITGVRGSFRRTAEGLRALREAKRSRGRSFPHVELKFVISGPSAPHLAELVKVVEETAPDAVTLQLEASIPYAWYEADQGPSRRGPMCWASLDEPPPDLSAPTRGELVAALEAFHAAWAGRKHPTLNYYPMTDAARLPNHLAGRLVNARATCASPWTDLFVGPWGEVGTCLVGTVGNVREEPLRRLFNAPKFREFRRRLRRKGIFQACRGCCFLQE